LSHSTLPSFPTRRSSDLICTGAAGGELIQVPMNGDTFDLEAILDAINEKTRLVFIANPNNPTGTLLDPTVIDRFLERVPSHVIVDRKSTRLNSSHDQISY